MFLVGYPLVLVAFIEDNHPLGPNDCIHLYNELVPIISGDVGSSVAATQESNGTPDLRSVETRVFAA